MTKTTRVTNTVASREVRWAKHLADWQHCGQSQRAFCAERGLALSSFRWWRKRLGGAKAPESAAAFLPIALQAQQPGAAAVIEVELRSRTRLRLEGEAALRALDRLVARIR